MNLDLKDVWRLWLLTSCRDICDRSNKGISRQYFGVGKSAANSKPDETYAIPGSRHVALHGSKRVQIQSSHIEFE